jgi:REP element-mobilizing transposase RayT
MKPRSPTSKPLQLAMTLPTWGGKRKHAGRKPKAGSTQAGVPHLRRPALAARFPVHVTVRMLPHVWNLRSRRSFAVIAKAIYVAAQRFAMRLCEFSVQGNHIHLVVEAADQAALARGMKGLGVRLARGLNKVMDKRRGQVLADRYHAHILRTPSEVKRAVNYVIHNHRKHVLERGDSLTPAFVDPYCSASRENGITLPRPHTWLLGQCRRENPGAAQ